VRNRASKAVKLPNFDRIEPPLVPVNHQALKFRPLLFGAGYPNVHIFAENLPSTPLAVLSKLARLHRRILPVVGRRNAYVESSSGHWGARDSFG
jgi:hypothetical protein